MNHKRLPLVAVSLALLLPCLAAARELEPVRHIAATADFSGGDKGDTATDISGMACLPPLAGARRCLVINDANRAAQFATLEGKRITPGDDLILLGDEASPATRGTAPAPDCPKAGKFGDLDGEGVAYAAPYFYISGSHGCSRSSGTFRLGGFHLARVRVDAAGRQMAEPELTYRLSDLLQRASETAPFFGRRLMGKDSRGMPNNGLNIEGIAVSGDRLWAGLRAPSLGGRAFLVGGSVSELFAAGPQKAASVPLVLAFQAGKDRGVRDLAALADGRLLVLVGPAQDQRVDYALLLLDPSAPAAIRELGTLQPRKNAKAEALTVLAEASGKAQILIGYDGVDNGEFEEYAVSLR